MFNDAACTKKNNDWVVFRQGPLLKITNTSLNVAVRAFPNDDEYEEGEDKIYYEDTDTQVDLVIDGETYSTVRVQ